MEHQREGGEAQRRHSPKNHHVERVVGDAGDERHKGDEEDGREQEVCTGHRAGSCLC